YVLLARSLYDRLDARLFSTLEATVSALKPALSKPGNDSIQRALDDLRFPNQTVAVMDANQQVIAQKIAPGGLLLRLPPSPLDSSESVRFFELPESGEDADDSCRAAFQRVNGPQPGATYTVVVAQSLETLEDQLELIQNFLYVVVPLILVVACLGGWFLARRSLAPVVTMSERAQRISVENLDQRLPVVNPGDELGRLAATFNELLARLNRSFNQQRQFMTDASHELRTPLSAIRTTSAVTLQKEDRETQEYREALTIIEQEARRLTRTVEDMFLLARADAGSRVLHKASLYLDELLAECGRAAGVLAAQKNLRLEIAALPEAPFFGDEALLRQMMWNLLGNAIKHTPQRGSIQVALETRAAEYLITVSDTGSGIPAEAKEHIFERFYRADESRARAETGS